MNLKFYRTDVNDVVVRQLYFVFDGVAIVFGLDQTVGVLQPIFAGVLADQGCRRPH